MPTISIEHCLFSLQHTNFTFKIIGRLFSRVDPHKKKWVFLIAIHEIQFPKKELITKLHFIKMAPATTVQQVTDSHILNTRRLCKI